MNSEQLFSYTARRDNFFNEGQELGFYEVSFTDGDIFQTTFNDFDIDIPVHFHKMLNKRRREYLAGRICIQKAFPQVGCSPNKQVHNTSDRAPVWPKNYTGSVSHTLNVAAACVARTRTYRSIGLDLEVVMDEKQARELSSQIIFGGDLEYIDAMPLGQFVTLVFSAKEAIFKAIYKEVGYIFGFEDVELVALDKAIAMFEIKKNLSSIWQKGSTIKVNYKKIDLMIYSLALLEPGNK